MAQFGDGGNVTDAIAAEISHHVSPVVGVWRYYDKFPVANVNGFQGNTEFHAAIGRAAEAIVRHLGLADGLPAPGAGRDTPETL